jgi:hypothetical protein
MKLHLIAWLKCRNSYQLTRHCVHLHHFKMSDEHMGDIRSCYIGNVRIYVTLNNMCSVQKVHEMNAQL